MRVTPLVIMLAILSGQAEAALLGRASGLAYYDTSTGLTWVKDARLAKTTGYDADGFLTWTQAQAWIASLNAQSGGLGYLGTNAWRLPRAEDLSTPGCNFGYSGTDCGYNVNQSFSELARLYHATLDNTGPYDTGGNEVGCGFPRVCDHFSPFVGTGTAWADITSSIFGNRAYFMFNEGAQHHVVATTEALLAWAVTAGDVLPSNLPGDTDGDGVLDTGDNCRLVSNPSQCDSDTDGFGNHCDGDLNNNGATNAQDTVLYRQQLGQPSVFPTYNKADMNCSGAVNAQDTTFFRQRLGSPPGPGAAP